MLIAGVNYLEPKVIAALQGYIAAGGAVIVSDDSKVAIPGATKLGVEAPDKLYNEVNTSWATDQKKSQRLRRVEYWLKEVEPYAKAIKAKISALGIKPAMNADSSSIVTQRQAQGDIEYLFAVNATPKAEDPKIQIEAADATLSIAADGRPIYDAIRGEIAGEFAPSGGNQLSAKVHFWSRRHENFRPHRQADRRRVGSDAGRVPRFHRSRKSNSHRNRRNAAGQSHMA